MTTRDLVLVVLVAIAPLAVVLVVALLRGYTINLTRHRDDEEGKGP